MTRATHTDAGEDFNRLLFGELATFDENIDVLLTQTEELVESSGKDIEGRIIRTYGSFGEVVQQLAGLLGGRVRD